MKFPKDKLTTAGMVAVACLVSFALTAAIAVTAVVATVSAIVAPVGLTLGLAYRDERGDVQVSIAAIVGGVLTIVVGLVLSTTILSQAATSGASANIGSFAGAQALNDLIPLIYYAVVVLIGVSMMGLGALSLRSKLNSGR